MTKVVEEYTNVKGEYATQFINIQMLVINIWKIMIKIDYDKFPVNMSYGLKIILNLMKIS